MKISELIETLSAIKSKFGDIAVLVPDSGVYVIDTGGREIWPSDDRNDTSKAAEIDGVAFE